MSLIKLALERPRNLTTTSKFTIFNGMVYLGLGLLLIVWPGQIQSLFGERAFVGDEQGLFRLVGMAVAIIGWYLVFGGRAASRQATAASVIDRLTIVPLVLLPLAIAGVFPHFMLAIVAVDVSLAISTWVLLNKVEKTEALHPRGLTGDRSP